MTGDWQRDGYVTVDLGLSAELIAEIQRDVLHAPEAYRSQKEHERADNPRIFQAWRYSDATKSLMWHPALLEAIEFVTGKRGTPFQTLNFVKGSQQPLHQDSIHFDCDPPGHMVGTWVALEDIGPDCGPLVVCPGSHRESRWDLTDLGYPLPERGQEFAAYAAYETFLAKLAQRYEVRYGVVPKGHALIWHGNLIHGGSKIRRDGATRWSQATHFVLDGWERFYCPMFGTDKVLP